MATAPKDQYPGTIASDGGSAVVAEDQYPGATVNEPTFGDKAAAFAKGAAGGFTEAGGMVAGAAAGAGLGMAAGGPVGAAALGALGAGAGAQVGKNLRGGNTVEAMDPALRPYGYAGEVVGGGAPFVAAPIGAAAAGIRAVQGGFGSFVNRIIDMAKSSPKSFAASEAAGLGGAAVGSGVAEAVAPGQPLARAGAEAAGGFFNPSRLVLGAFGGAVDGVKGLINSVGKTGQQQKAAELLQKLLAEGGEDPAKVSAFLRSTGIPGMELTSAMKSGSPALAALETKLSKDSIKFGAEQQRIGDEAMGAIKDMMVALRSTGDPQALRVAADIREKYFRSLIAGRLQIAEREATEAAGKISAASPKDRASISREADNLLQSALKDVRAAERELWEKIPKDAAAGTQSLTAKYAQLKNELLPNETLPSVIEGFIRPLSKEAEKGAILGPDGAPIRSFSIGSDTGETTSGNLMRFRSRALELARDASAAGNSGDARRYGVLAEAALDDLSAISSTTKGLDEARAFSKELHDTFTRTFAGNATATGRGGKDRIPPELTMKFALGGGREQGALQLRQIEEAMRFLPSKGLGGNQELSTMIDLQNRFVRLAASEAIDPMTGKVSQVKLANFINKNEEILDRFPDIKADLHGALSSAAKLEDVQRTLTGATKVIEREAAFAKFANTENPADVVRTAVTGANPVSDLNGLAKLAKKGGSAAVEGLRASVWDDAIRRATDSRGGVSVEKLYNNMFKPVGPNQPSLVNIMHDQGIINRVDITRAETLFKEFSKIEKAMAKGTNIERIGEIDPLFDMAARMAGVHAASIIAPKGPGAIVAAGRASQAARNLFEKVPLGKLKDVLIQAALDPKFAAMLLEKPTTQQAGFRLGRQIHAYMFQAGLTALEGE